MLRRGTTSIPRKWPSMRVLLERRICEFIGSSLKSFYGEEVEDINNDNAVRKEKAASMRLSDQGRISKPIMLTAKSIIDVVRDECDANVTIYELSAAELTSAIPLIRMVLQLESKRERVALAQVLIRRVSIVNTNWH